MKQFLPRNQGFCESEQLVRLSAQNMIPVSCAAGQGRDCGLWSWELLPKQFLPVGGTVVKRGKGGRLLIFVLRVEVLSADLTQKAVEVIRAGAEGSKSNSVLVSDISPNREVELDEDRYYPVGDETELARRLRSWIERGPLSGKEQERQLEMVKQRYNWDKIAEETLNVYKTVMSGRKSRRG